MPTQTDLSGYDYIECRAIAHAWYSRTRVLYENVSNKRQKRKHTELVEILDCDRCNVVRLDHFSTSSFEFLYRKYKYESAPGYLLLGRGRVLRNQWNEVRLQDAAKKATTVDAQEETL
jgi:hypothetical protein